MKDEIRKCAVFCLNSSGEPDIYYCKIRCSEEQFDCGDHIGKAIDMAEAEGYDPRLGCDERDPAGAVLQLFCWDWIPDKAAVSLLGGETTTEVAFTRLETGKLVCLSVIEFTHEAKLSSTDDLLDAFRRGVTKWVRTTGGGKTLWEKSVQDLNIGDIAKEIDNDALRECLKAEGIRGWKSVFGLCEDNEINYDTVLVGPEPK